MTDQTNRKKLLIEVWSDFVCPFCYIGKRHLEAGLQTFEHREDVELKWKSFQLDPNRVVAPGQTIYDMLAKKKGGTVAWAKQVSDQISTKAREVGLAYDFDRAIPANTFDAHRLAHLAAEHGLREAAEEKIMKAYFTEGRDIGNADTLAQIGLEIGLDQSDIAATLASAAFAKDVQSDQDEASDIGISGVPFFLLNRKLAVSGAQPVDIFRQALDQAWATVVA